MIKPAATAVVFAYHQVGVVCLNALLKQGIQVRLVITHEDNPNETIWFDSVASVAKAHNIACIKPDDPNIDAVLAQLTALAPDFIFSFYYRHMLSQAVINCASRGAYNMHGSLLPKYRGRVPINWAIIHGEVETGASLHVMVQKPDAGHLVDQIAVSIGEDENAHQVFLKVTAAAESIVTRAVPALINGTASFTAFPLLKGQYFAGRKPSDGLLNWTKSAKQIHDLVRALAPPYPPAYFIWQGLQCPIHQTKRMPSAEATGHPYLTNSLVIQLPNGEQLQILAHAFPDELLANLALNTITLS